MLQLVHAHTGIKPFYRDYWGFQVCCVKIQLLLHVWIQIQMVMDKGPENPGMSDSCTDQN